MGGRPPDGRPEGGRDAGPDPGGAGGPPDASSRWARVSAVLADALERPKAEREAFLREACGDDEFLRGEVESLLRAHDNTGLFDAMVAEGGEGAPGEGSGPGEGDGTRDAVDPVLPAGTRIGPYEVESLLGQGGIGAVYAARRVQGEFEQEVALKVLPEGFISPRTADRFRAERQILARLHHPNLARLLDGGVDDRGRPWFAMERIRGKNLLDFCRAKGLGRAARLDLFLKVCAAVEHAHRNLIIHRDLKPDNILVDESGTPHLLDFGIAKLLDPDRQGADGFKTRVGVRVLTPAYAAPEQLRGEPPTTASDVYQLGILAYELLSGVHPFPERTGYASAPVPASSTRASTTERKTEGPPPPSRAPGATAETAGLRGDLDAIVLKALRQDPDDRYASVAEMAADIRRHRDHRPVRARADSRIYRTRRFLRRNAAAVGVLLLIGAGGVAYTVGVAREAERTALERDRAEAVSRFLTDLFASARPDVANAPDLTVREILDQGAAQVRRDLAGEPATRIDLMLVMADAYAELGLLGQGAALMEDALAVMDESGDDIPADERVLTRIFITARLGRYLAARGIGDRSEALLSQAEERLEALAGAPRARRADVLNDLGLGWFMRGERERAAPLFQEAARLNERVDGAERDRAAVLTNLARLEADRSNMSRADSLYREALALKETFYGLDHLRVASTLAGMGDMHLATGRWAAADSAYRQSLAIRRQGLPEDHYLIHIANLGLAAVAARSGRTALADSLYLVSLAGLERQLGPDNAAVADARNDRGLFLRGQGRTREAIQELSRSRAAYLQLFGPDHISASIVGASLAWAHYLAGDPETAVTLFEKTVPALLARDSLDAGFRVHEMEYGASLCALDAERHPDAGDRAVARMEAAIAALDQIPEAAGQALYSLNVLGGCLASQGRYAEAEARYTEVVNRTSDWPEAAPYREYAQAQLQGIRQPTPEPDSQGR